MPEDHPPASEDHPPAAGADPPAYETVNLRLDGGAATIELNRPATLNAWDRQLGLDLLAAVDRVAGDPAVRAVVIRGAGRGFSSGADLGALRLDPAPDGRPDVRRILTGTYHPIIEGIRRMDKPVLAAVHGPAVGIGLSLALACDLVVAAQSAYFMLAFVNIGLVPDGGASAFVASRVGITRAAEMAMLGEPVAADRALAWGLINAVHPDDAFDAAVTALAARLAAGPTRSHVGAKRQLDRWFYRDLAAQLELEAGIQQEMARTGDFLEGVAAFVEKRPARFAGS
ncbi:MAG: 2-(1,2-epoxy,2-dihydrophenyl)acetyl-CoA isomerase [Solirubrobacteraceae bacterium]|jgi:2-(1,2-epoxy-1,2-dihydrophenyl)acetyl-CoA isomerase|nr:2-(1,2-epoxy,2-dihydrophenyl)acetyl-CoA isomerase [Solirubrobacteraceae bacterium]